MRLIKLAKDSHWFTEGLHRTVRRIKRAVNLLFFIAVLEKIKCYFILYNYYLVYLQHNRNEYGKSDSCAFAA